jgi:UDP-N-acetylmuramoyl-tripeptide--D-alanyl-D-alanine ligase
MELTALQIAAATSGRLVATAGPGSVLTDTRTLTPGSWFLALVGDRFDGHDYLAVAAEAGAAGVIVSRPSIFDGGCVEVADTTVALQDLGRHARATLQGPVVGLTGSSGKTTTRALVALALGELGPVHQNEGNLNNHLGVPMTLLAAAPTHRATVVEMGTSSHGEIGLLVDIAQPTVRLIVNVGPAHLLELGGLDGVAREKGVLFTSAGPDDLLCVNVDDPHVAALPRPGRVVTYGRGPADVQLISADVHDSGTDVVWRVGSTTHSAALPVPGEHIAHNATAALAVAFGLGLDVSDAAERLEAYAPVGMRQRRETIGSGVVAINDAYNANPQSMAASLRTLAAMSGRRVAVLGDMLELGDGEARWHQEVVDLALSLPLDLVVLVGPRMAAVRAPSDRVWAASDGTTLVPRLSAWLAPGDCVLFKGSRGAAVEQILRLLRQEAAG